MCDFVPICLLRRGQRHFTVCHVCWDTLVTQLLHLCYAAVLSSQETCGAAGLRGFLQPRLVVSHWRKKKQHETFKCPEFIAAPCKTHPHSGMGWRKLNCCYLPCSPAAVASVGQRSSVWTNHSTIFV